MKDQNLVSIIMPVYNSSAYLRETLDSVKKQRYKHYELIVVDDGSTDDSVSIVARYMRDDKRIKLIRQNNRHAGVARNNGLAIARGQFVIFLDSDDLFHRDMLTVLVNESEKYDADIVCFNFYRFSMKWYRHRTRLKYSGQIKRPEEIKEELLNLEPGVPWNKFYKTEFVRRTGLQFQDTVNSNDLYFTKLSFVYAKRIYFSEKTLIGYRCGNKNSLQGSRQKSPDSFYKALTAIISKLKEEGLYDHYIITLRKMVLNSCLGHLESADTPEVFENIYGYSRELFTSIQLDAKDETVMQHNRAQVIQKIIRDDYCGCIMEIYLAYKADIGRKADEYRIGRALVGIMKKTGLCKDEDQHN